MKSFYWWSLGLMLGWCLGIGFHASVDREKAKEAATIAADTVEVSTIGLGFDAYGNPICVDQTEPEEKEPFHCC